MIGNLSCKVEGEATDVFRGIPVEAAWESSNHLKYTSLKYLNLNNTIKHLKDLNFYM